MTRLGQWALGGVLVGGLIHIVAVLGVPLVTDKTPWNGIATLGNPGSFHLVTRDDTPIGGLDPAMVHAACAFDLDGRSASLKMEVAAALWTVSVFDSRGRSVFALAGQEPDIGVDLISVNQTRPAEPADPDAEQGEGATAAASGGEAFAAQVPEDKGFIVVRVYTPYEQDRRQVLETLTAARCV